MDTSPAVEQLRGKLEALAAQTVDTLPNLHHQAHAAAVGILRSMHINDDPDLIWWHRFNWSATSPLTVRESRMPISTPDATVPTVRPRLSGSASSLASGVSICAATAVSPTAPSAASSTP